MNVPNSENRHAEGTSHQGGLNAKTVGFSNPKHVVYKIGFKEGMHVADLGAGSGAYTMALAKLVGTSGSVYAVDIQRDLLTRIENEAKREKYENIKVVWGDIEEVDGVSIADELLDGVIVANTLFQIDEKNRVIQEAWRVLKAGGLLVVIDWSESFGGLGPQQNMVVSKDTAALLCADNQFVLKNEFNAGAHHYGMVFTKNAPTQNTQIIAEKTIEPEHVIGASNSIE